VQCWKHMERENLKPIRKGKVKYLPKLISRRIPSVSSVKRNDTLKRNAPNFRNGLRTKVMQSHSFVMNLIWSMSILTPGGLILDQQFTF
jgi:hypothetical protein